MCPCPLRVLLAPLYIPHGHCKISLEVVSFLFKNGESLVPSATGFAPLQDPQPWSSDLYSEIIRLRRGKPRPHFLLLVLVSPFSSQPTLLSSNCVLPFFSHSN